MREYNHEEDIAKVEIWSNAFGAELIPTAEQVINIKTGPTSAILPVRTAVGVTGDGRTYNFACALRGVTSVEGMTGVNVSG